MATGTGYDLEKKRRKANPPDKRDDGKVEQEDLGEQRSYTEEGQARRDPFAPPQRTQPTGGPSKQGPSPLTVAPGAAGQAADVRRVQRPTLPQRGGPGQGPMRRGPGQGPMRRMDPRLAQRQGRPQPGRAQSPVLADLLAKAQGGAPPGAQPQQRVARPPQRAVRSQPDIRSILQGLAARRSRPQQGGGPVLDGVGRRRPNPLDTRMG